MKKYIILITCVCAVSLVLGLNANLTYEDFIKVGDFISTDSSSVLAEVEFVKKIGTWLSMYSLEYDVTLRERDSGGLDFVDYIFIPPEESPNGNGQLYLFIDSYDEQLGVYTDLRRIGNMLEHDAIPVIPEDPDISDVIISIGSGIRMILEGIRYFSGLVYALIAVIFNSLPMILDLLRAVIYLMGFTNTL